MIRKLLFYILIFKFILKKQGYLVPLHFPSIITQSDLIIILVVQIQHKLAAKFTHWNLSISLDWRHRLLMEKKLIRLFTQHVDKGEYERTANHRLRCQGIFNSFTPIGRSRYSTCYCVFRLIWMKKFDAKATGFILAMADVTLRISEKEISIRMRDDVSCAKDDWAELWN